MFLDLHEGILEEFASAQRAQLIANEDEIEAWCTNECAIRDRANAALTERRRFAREHGRRPAPQPTESAEERRARQRARRLAKRRAWEAVAAAKVHAVRVSQPTWRPAQPTIERRPCARCGAPVEFRQGCRAPIVHRCRRPEAA